MKNIIYSALFFCCFLGFSTCLNYDTQFDGPYDSSQGDTLSIYVKSVVYVAGGNVYLADQLVRDSTIIDDSGTVTLASVNNDHTKVIFKRASENIQVYDIKSESLEEEVPNTAEAIWFEYHANNKTIYFLIDDVLDTYGPDVLANKPLDLSAHAPLAGEVTGVVVLRNGNLIFIVTTLSGNLTYNRLYVSDGNEITEERDIERPLKYLRIDKQEKTLWAVSNNSAKMYQFQFSSNFFQFDTEFSVIMGTPTSSERGFIINNDNSINALEERTLESPGGPLTCIDF